MFTLAIIFSVSAGGALIGAAIGLAGALAIAFVIYRLGHRLNLARFFTVIGVLLMVFAAGLLADAVQNLQELGWLPVLNSPLWHSATIPVRGQRDRRRHAQLLRLQRCADDAAAADVRWLSGDRHRRLPRAALPVLRQLPAISRVTAAIRVRRALRMT